ncbi:hypothetical protein [Polyangium fumosum]|uniref:Uncharacterized protein n=1 Tax=Polyangium fumosum TaxID=889272 RepID=A0A4U1JH56_9BACT|nr:hypothetical protein [Polyangium fumosum]TKD10030.1 hypothetical protein E8A74_10545 [Polyangium fumosum]
MKMRLIGPEGLDPFVYCSHGTPVPSEGDVVMGYEIRYGAQEYIRRKLNHLLNIRLILVPWGRNSTVALIYLLHWETEAETIGLDEKVFSDRYTDSDFEGSVRTVYSNTICFSCKRQWHTLIMPPGDYYPGRGSDMFYEKVAKREILRCPGCGSSLRQLVVKIIEEAFPEAASGHP